MYGIDGSQKLDEVTLDHLQGYNIRGLCVHWKRGLSAAGSWIFMAK